VTEAPGLTKLPHRPRLADAALLRRHRIDGVDRWMLHDTSRQEALELTHAQVEQCLACDGTRDVGGVLVASARRGSYRRASDTIGFLTELAERGLLADGAEPPNPRFEAPGSRRVEAADRPLEILPDYRLLCSGRGSCCSTYGSIPFSPAERRRADAAVPEVAETLGRHRFLPLHGAEPGELRAVATVDGACAFLADGRCRVHARAGKAAKPRACRAFPAQLVDDGEAVRVSVAVECACVLASLQTPDGSPLVPDDTSLAGLLPPGTHVLALPEELGVAPGRHASRAEVRNFTSRVLEGLPTTADGIGFAWGLADHVERHGLDLSMPKSLLPSPEELAPWLRGLHDELREKRRNVEWRSPRDRSRLRTDWLFEVATSLLEPGVVSATLASVETLDAQDEAFTIRTSLWGYRLLDPDLVTSLRDRAVRFLLARRSRAIAPDPGEPAQDHPIAAVEAMMRGQGLDAYVQRR